MTVSDNSVVVKPRLRGVSHLYAFFVAIVAAVALVATAPSGTATIGATVYAITLVGMFGASALYHRGNWSPTMARRMLQLDHTAIFLLIAGTYTPIALLAMSGTEKDVLLPLVWIIAIGGIVYEWLPMPAPRGYVTAVYLTLGWIGAFGMISLWEHAGPEGVLLIAAGASATRSARSCTRPGGRIPGPRPSATTRSSTCS